MKQVLITVHAKLKLPSINVLCIYHAKMTRMANFYPSSHTNVKIFDIKLNETKLLSWCGQLVTDMCHMFCSCDH